MGIQTFSYTKLFNIAVKKKKIDRVSIIGILKLELEKFSDQSIQGLNGFGSRFDIFYPTDVIVNVDVEEYGFNTYRVGDSTSLRHVLCYPCH